MGKNTRPNDGIRFPLTVDSGRNRSRDCWIIYSCDGRRGRVVTAENRGYAELHYASGDNRAPTKISPGGSKGREPRRTVGSASLKTIVSYRKSRALPPVLRYECGGFIVWGCIFERPRQPRGPAEQGFSRTTTTPVLDFLLAM